jgi:hypothetical protein
MLRCLVIFPCVMAMSWICWLEMEGMQLKKDSFIRKSTCYITPYSTLILSYRLVTHTRAAFEETGIWPHNPSTVFIQQSRNITWFESTLATPTPLSSATWRKPWAANKSAHSAVHLVTHQSPSSVMLKAFIAPLRSSAQAALADKWYGDEMLSTLCSGVKYTTTVTATDCRNHA